MAEQMKAIMVIKKYLEKDASHIPLMEMKEFLAACTDDEKLEFARTAAKELGVELVE